MYKRYKAKHYKENKNWGKFIVVVILLYIFVFENISGIYCYFTATDTITNQFTIAKIYTIHFDSNNGTGTMSDQKMFVGHSASLNSNIFTRAGYGFNGWNTEPNGAGTSYADGVHVQDLAVADSSITLYAQWLAGAYSITYNLDGGEIEPSNPTAYTIDTATFILNNPTKTGYTFTGWSGTDLTGYTNLAVTITQGSTGDRSYTAHFTPNTYYIRFNANGGTGTMENQEMTYGTSATLTPNSFEKPGYVFEKWNTLPNGSGENYSDKQNVNNLTATDGAIVDLYAHWEEETNEAEIVGGKKYPTVKAAINAVAANGGQKTIKLLKNVQLKEALTIAEGKDIVFNLQNFTLSNGTGCTNIIKNNGTLEITGGSNGRIQSSAGYGAIDNNTTGNLTVSAGNIITTGTRQAIYNNGGTVEVTGTAYLSTNAADRATVLNHKPDNGTAGTFTISGGTIVSTTTTSRGAVENEQTGTMIITGGTIISSNNIGVDNKGTLTIGVEDGVVDTSSPIIQGATYGVSSASSRTLELYDGTVKGKTHAFNDENYITDTEDIFDLTHGSETIDGDNYETAYLDSVNNRLVFYGNGGTPTETIVYIPDNTEIGALLPSPPTRTHYTFDGWFTNPNEGTQITSGTVITNNGSYYAHWTQTEAEVTFNANGGTVDGTNEEDTVVVNINSSIGSANLPTPTRTYKQFDGWYTDPDPNMGTLIDGTETITQDVMYYAHWSALNVTVNFDPTSGTIPQIDASRTVEAGDQVGPLPITATCANQYFAGWYTDPINGTRIDETEIIGDTTVTFYAHWISNAVARIGVVHFTSVQLAIRDVPTDNTETTIVMVQNSEEAVEVIPNQNIVLDLNGYTLYNNGNKQLNSIIGTDPRKLVIENSGTLTVTNGTITCKTSQAGINNNTNLTIDGVTINQTGTRQVLYNNGGTVLITGGAYLSTTSTSERAVIQGNKPSGVTTAGTITIDGATIVSATSKEYGAIENPATGTVIILDGSITSINKMGINNKGILTLGEEDGTAGYTTPVIQGKIYGVKTSGTGSEFNFYDGIVKGVTDSLNGSVADYEDGASRVNGTETIGTDTYKTTCYK